MNGKIQNGLYYFNLPGIIIHELAHALVIFMIPNIWITELNLTSKVEYKGRFSTATRTFLIGYAPLFINTSISLACIYYISSINTFESLTNIAYSIVLIYISLTTAFSSLPSVADAIAPLKLLRSQLFTKRFILILIMGPLFVILSLPGLIISYMNSKSIYIHILFCSTYTIFVFMVGFDVIDINMTNINNIVTLIENYNYNLT